MDIVAENLSVGQLNAADVKIKGFDIKTFFESKLSDAVNFVGVYTSLNEVNRKNGNIAIVDSKEYIYSESQNKWCEIGDETFQGQLAEQIVSVANEISNYVKNNVLDEFKNSTESCILSISNELVNFINTNEFNKIVSSLIKANDISNTIALCSEEQLNEKYMLKNENVVFQNDLDNQLTSYTTKNYIDEKLGNIDECLDDILN